MILFIVACLCVIAAIVLAIIALPHKSDEDVGISDVPYVVLKWLVPAALVVAMASGFFSSCKVVPVGNVGVVTTFGKVDPKERYEGINFTLPWSNLHRMNIQIQEYTMASSTNEGKVQGDDAIQILTKDGVSIKTDVTVLYALSPNEAPRVYRTIGIKYEAKVIRPLIRTVLRDEAVKYSMESLYGSDSARSAYLQGITYRLTEALGEKGVILDKFMLRKILLPSSVMKSIEAKKKAEQDVLRMDAEIEVTKKEAEKRVAEAQGLADAQTIIERKLTDKYLMYLFIQNLKAYAEGDNNTVVIIPNDLKAMIQLPK